MHDCASGRVLASSVRLAGASRERRTGLLGRAVLEAGAGLWIAPSEAIHTFGMQFPIDAIFLDKQQRVCKISPHVRPSRIAFCWRADSVLEIEAGSAERAGLRPGALVKFISNVEGGA